MSQSICTFVKDETTRAVLLKKKKDINEFEVSQVLDLEEKSTDEHSSVCRLQNGNLLCAFYGFFNICEISIHSKKGKKTVNAIELVKSHKAPAQIRYIAIGNPNGKELVFASFNNNTVRSLEVNSEGLDDLGLVALKDPQQVLWEPRLEQLLVVDWEYDTNAKKKLMNVKVILVGQIRGQSGHASQKLKVHKTALSADRGVEIESWCWFGEKEILSFDRMKKNVFMLKLDGN